MKILMLRNTVADGMDVEAGQVVDVRDETARFLIQIGKAGEAPAQDACGLKPKRRSKSDGES